MRVLDVMRRYPLVATADMDLARAGRTMAEAGCGMLPVTDDEERVVGVLTDRDLALTVSRMDQRPSQLAVLQAISGEAWTCRAEDAVLEALSVMRQRKVRRLPVVDDAGRLHGVLSLDDVALEARPAQTAEPGHPLDVAVAETLRAICEHPTLAVR